MRLIFWLICQPTLRYYLEQTESVGGTAAAVAHVSTLIPMAYYSYDNISSLEIGEFDMFGILLLLKSTRKS